MPTVQVNPELLRWAVDRSGLDVDDLRKPFPKVDEWLSGEKPPTFRQLQDFAKRTMTPFGMLLLAEPPEEDLGIPDFRTIGDAKMNRPSPNLLATIDEIRRRQAFVRDVRIDDGFQSLAFVGSQKPKGNVVSAANHIRKMLGLLPEWAETLGTWEDALLHLRRSAENIGILVFSSSVVGLNNFRPLDPEEFRGFVLVDDIAPAIFLNDGDTKSARMFTLAHELVHVWIGQDALVNLSDFMPAHNAAEKFCNAVAAEFLVPEHKLLDRWAEASATLHPFANISRWFKVSPVVAARRALDLNLISESEFFRFYKEDRAAFFKRKKSEREKEGGPSFYAVQQARLGRPFAEAVVRSVREGRLLYSEAHRLTGMKGETFNRFANQVLERTKNERQ
ncbi:MAG: ImmA/IrrE family metallo-endopeptidase [Candidatus Paceibacterota bacterium]